MDSNHNLSLFLIFLPFTPFLTMPNHMPEQTEGVIQFNMNHQYTELDPRTYTSLYHSLNGWRTLLRELGLVGMDPDRYEGIGFGNVSLRSPVSPHSFLITGSQTGQYKQLTLKQYCVVTQCHFQTHTLDSKGEILPSSESMTHGMMYQLDHRIQAVFHIHSPLLWNCSHLDVPSTPAHIGYGTLAMTHAVRDMYQNTSLSHLNTMDGGHLRMGGHQDGLISIGAHLDETGHRLLALWRKAHTS